jgi:DNA-binding NtrC family response regulator
MEYKEREGNKFETVRERLFDFDSLVTVNKEFLEVIHKSKKISMSDIPVLLVGESGTGKSCLALAIHAHSRQKEGAFIEVNGSDCSLNILEEYIKKASLGTLVIDNIDHLGAEEQHVLFEAICNVEERREMRTIATCLNGLGNKVKQGSFREDLFAILNQVSLTLPSLFYRKEDIALLIQYYIGEYNIQFQKHVECMSNVALSYLINYEWPGNVSELRSVLKRAVVLAERNILWLEDIPLKITLTNESLLNGDQKDLLSLKYMEKEHITKVLYLAQWNKSKAALFLKISRPRLERKIQEFQLKKPPLIHG